MIGDEALQAGSASFQAILESVDHSTGRSFAEPTPVPSGPRKAGHSSVADTDNVNETNNKNTKA